MKRRLLDSNILIYSSKPEYAFLREYIREGTAFLSVINKVEVLGYPKLLNKEAKYLKRLFEVAPVLPVTNQVIDHAIKIRAEHNLSLGDALIGGTAMHYKLGLVTRNDKDFSQVSELEIFNPIDKK